MPAKKRHTGYAAKPLLSGLTTSARKPSDDRSDQSMPPRANTSRKITFDTTVRGWLHRASPVQLARSSQLVQAPPMFAVSLAELRHTPSGQAGGPHVVVIFPPFLFNSPRPHVKVRSDIVRRTMMHRTVARIIGATQYPRRQMFWKKETFPPRSLALTVTTTAPAATITRREEKTAAGRSWFLLASPSDSSILSKIAKIRQRNSGPHRSQFLSSSFVS
mmetsp:Transcript_13344/g.26290  ORF Transcript_13344/g.26290 Transcript_13344/m.26290 type:complete len:218 (-) Transcript_13344:216-869(-)